jgi:hypothetical protein
MSLVIMTLPGAATAQFRHGGTLAFAEGHSALAIPFELNSDKMYLNVRLNDRGPYWLVLDTGSPGMILDTRVGSELEISTGEGFEVGGAGENVFVLAPADSTFTASLPGVTLHAQPAHVGGIDRVVGPFEGRRLDGVLGGFNIFSEYIVEVDYLSQTIGIYDRDAYTQPVGGTVVPIEVTGGHCIIKGTAIFADGDSLGGEFLLDTGLRGTLVFSSPFVNEHGLLDRCGDVKYTTMGGGIGGQVKAHVGRLNGFVFGGFSMGTVYTSLSQLTRGALASPDLAGIIGSAILQRFRVVFDYAGERLILYEQAYDHERLDFDKSGCFLVSDREDRSVYSIIDVIEGSPAGEAGLQAGDIIREINGRSTLDVSLEQARRLFRREVGTTYRIVFERAGERHATKLTLRRVI